MKKLTIELTERQVEMARKFATNQFADGFGEEVHYVYDGETYYTLDGLKEFICEEYGQTEEENLEDGPNEELIENVIINACEDWEALNELLEENSFEQCEAFNVEEVWKPVAMFFIREEAVAYQKYQAHNLGKCRVYTYSTGYGNNGSMKDLGELLLTMGNQLMKEDPSNADK